MVVLQNGMDIVEGEAGSYSETVVRCGDDVAEEVSFKVVKDEIPEAITFQPIKTEQEVRLCGV
jgi:hypothetical protein